MASPGTLLRSGIKPVSSALAGGFFATEPPGKPPQLLVEGQTHTSSGSMRKGIVNATILITRVSLLLVCSLTHLQHECTFRNRPVGQGVITRYPGAPPWQALRSAIGLRLFACSGGWSTASCHHPQAWSQLSSCCHFKSSFL